MFWHFLKTGYTLVTFMSLHLDCQLCDCNTVFLRLILSFCRVERMEIEAVCDISCVCICLKHL